MLKEFYTAELMFSCCSSIRLLLINEHYIVDAQGAEHRPVRETAFKLHSEVYEDWSFLFSFNSLWLMRPMRYVDTCMFCCALFVYGCILCNLNLIYVCVLFSSYNIISQHEGGIKCLYPKNALCRWLTEPDLQEVIMLPAQLESVVLVESGALREGAGSQKAESSWSFWYICRCGFEWWSRWVAQNSVYIRYLWGQKWS